MTDLNAPPIDLEQVNVDMFAEAFRLENRFANQLLKWALKGTAAKVAQTGATYEALVDEHDTVQEASRWLASVWSRSVRSIGDAHVPAEGPVLLLSNHPGMGDAVAVHATLPRPDVYTFVKVRTLLNALPNFLKYCVVMDEENPMTALRRSIRLLKEGRCLLFFPRGEMEADPHQRPADAIDSVDHWSKSIELIARRVPNCTIIPVAIGGVISQKAMNSRLAGLYRNRFHRDYMAATLQFMYPSYRSDVDVTVLYGEPIPHADFSLERVQFEQIKLIRQLNSTGSLTKQETK